MTITRALWVGMLVAAMATPAWASSGRIQFVGSIVVPAACTADIQIRHGAPNATVDCGIPASASTPQPWNTPLADVAVRPLQAHTAQAGGLRRYVIDMTYR
ncbi:MAG TPA: hypothetical protein VEA17_12030 [Bordetella sp.]|nr:hypothetical protein [Bordetella sp.]